jgi:hypothetical protein
MVFPQSLCVLEMSWLADAKPVQAAAGVFAADERCDRSRHHPVEFADQIFH